MSVKTSEIPTWLAELDEDDLQFMRRMVLASGSLKDLAEEYGVSYPTIRVRLDRLIEKIKTIEASTQLDPFEKRVRVLVADGKLSSQLAKELIKAHKQSQGE